MNGVLEKQSPRLAPVAGCTVKIGGETCADDVRNLEMVWDIGRGPRGLRTTGRRMGELSVLWSFPMER